MEWTHNCCLSYCKMACKNSTVLHNIPLPYVSNLFCTYTPSCAFLLFIICCLSLHLNSACISASGFWKSPPPHIHQLGSLNCSNWNSNQICLDRTELTQPTLHDLTISCNFSSHHSNFCFQLSNLCLVYVLVSLGVLRGIIWDYLVQGLIVVFLHIPLFQLTMEKKFIKAFYVKRLFNT